MADRMHDDELALDLPTVAALSRDRAAHATGASR